MPRVGYIKGCHGIQTCIFCNPETHEIWTVKQYIGPELNTKVSITLLIKACADITLLRTYMLKWAHTQ